MCSVEFDRKDISMNKLVATSLEGKFNVFDMRIQHPTKGFASVSEKVSLRALTPRISAKYLNPLQFYLLSLLLLSVFKAHKSTVWQVRHLPQNRDIFMTTGGAGNLHLWK